MEILLSSVISCAQDVILQLKVIPTQFLNISIWDTVNQILCEMYKLIVFAWSIASRIIFHHLFLLHEYYVFRRTGLAQW